MFERFTDHARQVVVRAQEESRLLHHGHLGTEHLLLGIVGVPDSPAVGILTGLGLTPELVRAAVLAVLPPGRAAESGHIPFTPKAKKALETSLRVALELNHNYIGAEHLLLGLLRTDEGGAAQILNAAGVDFAAAREAVRALVVPAAAPLSIFADLQRLEAKIDALTLMVQALETRLPPPDSADGE